MSGPSTAGRGRGLSPRLRPLLVLVALQLAVSLMFRGAFWALFRPGAGIISPRESLLAWYLGAKFDLRLALLTTLPFLLLSWIRPLDPLRRSPARWLWTGYFVTAELLFVVMYLVNLGHYGYLHAPLDAGILDLLGEPGIALRMAWESYPLLPGAVGLAAFAVAFALVTQQVAFGRPLGGPENPVSRTPLARRAVASVACGLLVALGVYGKWSWYPLRWSHAFFSPNGFVTALALNPVLFVVDTYQNRRVPYDESTVRKHYHRVARYLEVQSPDSASLSFARHGGPSLPSARRPNLVVIQMESFASFKTGFGGNALNPTPAFDAAARESIAFTSFFVPASLTARSVFTLITGIPDLNAPRSASRNARIATQRTLITELEGYRKFYVIGGSATWGNIRALLAHNIPGIRIIEEGDYDAERVDVWGVSVLTLFERAHAEFLRTPEPFFALIHTSENHRPFALPKHHGDFRPAALDAATLTRNGFGSLDAYNSFRFLDYGLGRFLELARSAPYYENTLFVIYGDHGYAAPSPTPWEQLELTLVHVPLLFHGPGVMSHPLPHGRRVETVASLMDVLPTALGLMGMPYLNTTLGRDLMAPRPPEDRFAFIRAGVLTDDLYLKRGADGRGRLYRYRSGTPTLDLADSLVGERARLEWLYDALAETSRYLLYHNVPAPAPRD